MKTNSRVPSSSSADTDTNTTTRSFGPHLNFFETVRQVVGRKETKASSPTILIERVHSGIYHVIQFYCIAAFASTNPYSITAFRRERPPSRLTSALRRLRQKAGEASDDYREQFYKSLGVARVIGPRPNLGNTARARNFVRHAKSVVRTKEDLETIKINGVWVGDLVYDQFIKDCPQRTIELWSPEFEEFFSQFVANFFWWESRISSEKVAAVFSSVVYSQGIVPRISSYRGIPTFQFLPHDIFRVGPNEPALLPYANLLSEAARELTEDERANLTTKGKALFGDTNAYDNFNFYLPNSHGHQREGTFRPAGRDRSDIILVALHDFSDSPHALGIQLFPDVYEWAMYLAEVAEHSSRVWFVKPHPTQPEDDRLARDIFEHLENVSILPSSADNTELIRQGVAAVVTINGSIAVEFAAQGVPVIACAREATYRSFGFAHFPRDREHLREMLLGPALPPPRNGTERALEFYSYVNFYNPQNKFFLNYFDVMRNVKAGGQSVAYREFERECAAQPNLIELRIKSLEAFFQDDGSIWYQPPQLP